MDKKLLKNYIGSTKKGTDMLYPRYEKVDSICAKNFAKELENVCNSNARVLRDLKNQKELLLALKNCTKYSPKPTELYTETFCQKILSESADLMRLTMEDMDKCQKTYEQESAKYNTGEQDNVISSVLVGMIFSNIDHNATTY